MEPYWLSYRHTYSIQMNFRIYLFTILLLLQTFNGLGQANPLVSGPMIGYVEANEVLIWIEAEAFVRTVELNYWEKGKDRKKKKLLLENELTDQTQPIKFTISKLEPNTVYEYELTLNKKDLTFPFELTFKTQPEPQKDKSFDFSFLFGSCLNNPSPLLITMGDMESDFMLWGGDNLYFSESEVKSEYKMRTRYSHTRQLPEIQKLIATRANYAIWDDHDFALNDMDSRFVNKAFSLKLFKEYWGNKYFGELDNHGTYSSFRWGDTEFFLMDDRYYRSSKKMQGKVSGKPNPDKHFYGKRQLEWLKNGLKNSDATFKFIVSGSQMLNGITGKECFRQYNFEFEHLMNFIKDNKIEGILFLSGDRHFSEMLTYQKGDGYKFYEFTCSAMTSAVHQLDKNEQENPQRVPNTLLQINNFSKISVTGAKSGRVVKIETFDTNGIKQWEYDIRAEELR